MYVPTYLFTYESGLSTSFSISIKYSCEILYFDYVIVISLSLIYDMFQGTSVLSPASPLFLLVIPAWVIAYKSDQVRSAEMLTMEVKCYVFAEYLSRPSDPVCVAVWADRSQDHQQTGGGSHVQGRDHAQGRLPPGSLDTYIKPVLQLLHSGDNPAISIHGLG